VLYLLELNIKRDKIENESLQGKKSFYFNATAATTTITRMAVLNCLGKNYGIISVSCAISLEQEKLSIYEHNRPFKSKTFIISIQQSIDRENK
jgi:hypothetical protein